MPFYLCLPALRLTLGTRCVVHCVRPGLLLFALDLLLKAFTMLQIRRMKEPASATALDSKSQAFRALEGYCLSMLMACPSSPADVRYIHVVQYDTGCLPLCLPLCIPLSLPVLLVQVLLVLYCLPVLPVCTIDTCTI